jgi:hypothetical protein
VPGSIVAPRSKCSPEYPHQIERDAAEHDEPITERFPFHLSLSLRQPISPAPAILRGFSVLALLKISPSLVWQSDRSTKAASFRMSHHRSASTSPG